MASNQTDDQLPKAPDEAHAITDEPRPDQRVVHEGRAYRTQQEGAAFILIPDDSKPSAEKNGRGEGADQSVFYNPIQRYNRDLTVLAIKAFAAERESSRRQKADQGPGKRSKGSKKRKRDQADGPAEATAAPAGTDGQASSANADATAVVEPSQAADRPVHLPEAVDRPQPAGRASFRILDALSATGLRALRYAREIPEATYITANDMSPDASQAIELNIKLNGLQHLVRASTANALGHMYAAAFDAGRRTADVVGGKYDVIDLDPYGTAAPFFDAAVQATKDGGLLCATCTDPGVFASTGYPEKTFALYGGTPVRGPHSHEAGLRLILHAIATSAARHGLAIDPLLSLSIDYYARVFVRLRRSPAAVKFLAGKTMLVYGCDHGCGAWTTQPLVKTKENTSRTGEKSYRYSLVQGPTASPSCVHCGFKSHLAGPMYAGPLHSPSFIRRMLDDLPAADPAVYQTKGRIEGMLLTALEEDLSVAASGGSRATTGSEADGSRDDPARLDRHPFFFIPANLSKVLHCQTPHEHAIRGALLHLGFRVSRSHCKPGSIKTDAPWTVIWEVMRQWAVQKAPIKEGAVKPGTAGWNILHKASPTGRGGDSPAPAHDQMDSPNAEADRERHEIQVNFDMELGREKDRKRLVRYQLNPTANWGPMNRAKGSVKS